MLRISILNNRNIFRRGFTLIELLVVISIIGLLSTIVLAALNDARAKARDARRLSDVNQLKLALELYRDLNGSYPVAKPACGIRESSCYTNGDCGKPSSGWGTQLSGLITNKFIPKLPQDPINKGQYCYSYYSDDNTSGAGSVYDSCKNVQTGEIASTTDYEYRIFLSLEKPPNNRFDIFWNNMDNLYVNTCILGPKRK